MAWPCPHWPQTVFFGGDAGEEQCSWGPPDSRARSPTGRSQGSGKRHGDVEEYPWADRDRFFIGKKAPFLHYFLGPSDVRWQTLPTLKREDPPCLCFVLIPLEFHLTLRTESYALGYAKISRTTLPCTSVSRKSRPWTRYVKGAPSITTPIPASGPESLPARNADRTLGLPRLQHSASRRTRYNRRGPIPCRDAFD